MMATYQKVAGLVSKVRNARYGEMVKYLETLIDSGDWRDFSTPAGTRFQFRECEFDYSCGDGGGSDDCPACVSACRLMWISWRPSSSVWQTSPVAVGSLTKVRGVRGSRWPTSLTVSRRGRRRGRLARAVHDLSSLLEATEQIIEQTRQRIAGITPDGASRVVSLHDREARPIAKGRLGKPVEFGYKGQIVDNDDGIVVDHDVQAGNPADAPQLAPAIQRVKARAGRAPRTVTADRGYGEAAVDDALASLGVRTVVIPRKGRPGLARQQLERRRTFRRTVKWRTGCEGRISTLKRAYGWDRTRVDSLQGAKTWTGQGIFTHNLTKIAALTA